MQLTLKKRETCLNFFIYQEMYNFTRVVQALHQLNCLALSVTNYQHAHKKALGVLDAAENCHFFGIFKNYQVKKN